MAQSMRLRTLLACLLIALGVSNSSRSAVAQAPSVLDLVRECDVLAAHPDDPDRYADGVADDEIVPKLAIMACEAQIEENADDPRFKFQLGRALLAAGKKAEANAEFQKAADAGYAAAAAYLGDAYQFGLGAEIDPQKAFANYKKAYDGGFELAKGQLDQLQFEPKMYTAEFLALFFARSFDQISAKSNDVSLRNLVRNYVYNLVNNLISECGDVLQPATIPKFYLYRYPSGWTLQSDENIGVAIQTSVAENDTKIFLKRHGCEGAVAKHIFTEMNNYFASQ